MIGDETVEAAKNWCEVGANWIKNGAVKLGLNYLDRAVSVFSENGELNWLTYARHSKLDGLKRTGWEEEAEAMFDQVMRGYLHLGDSYGQALLLSHLAECMASQGRRERALTQLNLASAIAESAGLNALQAHLLSVRAGILMDQENLIVALRLYRQAEELLEQDGREMEALHLRYSAAESLVKLGERADAAAFLEDLQTKLMRGRNFRDALEPLDLLSKLYEESGAWDDRDRIKQLLHLCGQSIVQEDSSAKARSYTPPIVRLVEYRAGETGGADAGDAAPTTDATPPAGP